MLNKKALAATAAAQPVYIEDVFSTYLYTGNGSALTITNGIDLSGEGGLVWIKRRDTVANHGLMDSARGAGNFLQSNTTAAEASGSGLTFNSDGFSLGTGFNVNGGTNASWTFRKAEKFFDIVTYTGNGTSKTISHNLGSTPGCIFIKRTDAGGVSSWWAVYHRSLSNPSNNYLRLDSANAEGDYGGAFISSVTSTSFTVNDSAAINVNNGTYVAYLFAHDAGGFGDSGNDSVISCGSYTGNGLQAGPSINLGWEPQLVIIKRATGATADWLIHDNIRGIPDTAYYQLRPNTDEAEASAITTNSLIKLSAAGFQINSTGTNYNANGSTYIYIAIRRGPMKTPEAGTSVYTSGLSAGTTTSPAFTSNFVVDLAIKKVPSSSNDATLGSRLQGARVMYTTASSAEEASTAYKYDFNNGFGYGYSTSTRAWLFRRAPKFMDVVCFTGDGTTNKSISHNLGATPNLIIAKSRSTSDWLVYTSSPSYELVLNTSDAEKGQVYDFYPSVNSSTVFGVAPSAYSGAANINVSGITYVAYLFATLAGVSKVGSYTGTGTTKQIDCGFTSGARFVMIKRADSTGDWYVWDSSRGIVAGNDPYMLLNLPDPDVTNTDYIDTYSQGFEISSTAPAAINANGGTFIFLAIA